MSWFYNSYRHSLAARGIRQESITPFVVSKIRVGPIIEEVLPLEVHEIEEQLE